jgi:hypothetical protein
MGLFDTIGDFLGSGIGETLVGVGGDLASAYLGGQSAGEAADVYAQSLGEGRKVTDEAIARARGDVMGGVAPGLEDLISGYQGAISTLETPGQAEQQALALSGALGPEAEQAAIAAFQESPGQKFLREQGEQAITRNAAAVGGLGGGRIRQALQEHGIGTAAQNMQQRFLNLGSMVSPETTRASNIANILSSGGGQLAQFRSGAGSQLANLAMGGLSQQIPLITGTGQARAAGVLGQSAATQQGIGNISSTLGQLYA